MADGITGTGSAGQILSNYEKYKEFFTTNKNDNLGQDQFLMLMVEQMKNQDFTKPTDNSEYIAQMAQFSSVQQMQQMTYYTNANYASSLVGKTVSLGSIDNSTGEITKTQGVVSSVKMNDKEFEIIVNGKPFSLSNVMEILNPSSQTTEGDKKPKD